MPMRERSAILISPLFLRLVLGTVFLWAGLGKVLDHYHASPTDAAALANMGVAVTASPAPAPAAEPASAPAGGLAAMPAPVQARLFTAEDFGGGADVMRVYGIAVLLRNAANPPVHADGTPSMPLWPEALGTGARPVYAAWAAALTEIIAGFFVLLGLVTRLSAISLAVVIATALWLTQIGPAVQSGNTRFGFLPAYPAFGGEWQTFFMQYAMLMTALALAFAGPGLAGLDRAVFRSRSRPADADEDGD